MSNSKHVAARSHHTDAPGHSGPSSSPAEAAGAGRKLNRIALAALICLVAGGLAIIGLSAHVRAVAKPDSGGKPAAAHVDPRLILRPHTLTLSRQSGGLRLEMTISPLIPGVNHLSLLIAGGKQALGHETVTASATMLGMAMRPLQRDFRAGAGSRYAASLTLPMFGNWQITVHVRQAHGQSLTTLFPVTLGLPADLFSTFHAVQG